MTTKEMQFAYKVKLALDANLDNLSDDTLQHLSAARRVAMARKKKAVVVRVQQPVLAGALGGTMSDSPSWLSRIGVAVPLLAGIILFAGIYQHETAKRVSELAEIDAAVLSDELPLSAYLDHGFNAFLAEKGE
jgi:protein-S-isoprenylcysteine O-methyltransferase Ste14